MSYFEAVNDKIRINDGYGKNRITTYYPECQYCGQEVKTFSYSANKKYSCEECKDKNKISVKMEQEENIFDKKEEKLKTAVKRISEVADINKYEKAINLIHKNLHNAGWFQSTEEIMVGIELIKCGEKIKHQVKIGKYCVDFAIPSKKLVIEVDGTIFHPKSLRGKEYERDEYIKYMQGHDWQIVHISDTDINTNVTKLGKAIISLQRGRQAMLDKYGYVPKWYSDRAI